MSDRTATALVAASVLVPAAGIAYFVNVEIGALWAVVTAVLATLSRDIPVGRL